MVLTCSSPDRTKSSLSIETATISDGYLDGAVNHGHVLPADMKLSGILRTKLQTQPVLEWYLQVSKLPIDNLQQPNPPAFLATQ